LHNSGQVKSRQNPFEIKDFGKNCRKGGFFASMPAILKIAAAAGCRHRNDRAAHRAALNGN
jgi:hypothetical protein